MANRRELQERREKLRSWLIDSCENGTLKVGTLVPPVRVLALEHGVSTSAAFEVIRELADEGLLYTHHGAGTFVGRMPTRNDLFLLIIPDKVETKLQPISIRNGFESYLTRLGGTCLTLSHSKALQYQASGQLEGLMGVGEVCLLVDEPQWEGTQAQVAIREVGIGATNTDTVYLDNEDAAQQATQHLLNLGHRRIAFLGVHPAGIPYAGSLDWSRQREVSWRCTMNKENCDTSDLLFCPHSMPRNSHPGLREAGRTTGQALASYLIENKNDVTAVIVSNSHSTFGMFDAFQQARIEEDLWPAVVSFDDFTTSNNHLLSVLRPSWEELGRQGAALLWERVQGRLESTPQYRPVSMELIPRFSCRPRQMKVPHASAIIPNASLI